MLNEQNETNHAAAADEDNYHDNDDDSNDSCIKLVTTWNIIKIKYTASIDYYLKC